MASSGRASAYKSIQLDLWQIHWSSVFVVAIALALGSMPCWGWLPGPDRTQPPARGTVPPRAFSIPFQLLKGYEIVVTGTLGPLGQMRLAVDTGTHPTVIHRRVAQALGLGGKMVGLKLFNQTLPVEEAVLPELTLGPIHKRNLPVVISDLDTVEREINGRVDAIIGFAVLGERSFTIDYDKQEIVFGPVDSKGGVPFTSRPPFVTVPARFGNQSVSLLVDTGTSGLVLFTSRMQGKLDAMSTALNAQARNLGGKFDFQTVILPKARLGNNDLGPAAAFIVQDRPDDGRVFDGLMGIPFLHPRRISFDFENEMFSWSGSR
jgi:hypothetical protein